jgi:COMPASS component SPP1
LARLRPQLEKVVHLRDVLKDQMEVILWREALTHLASERSEELDECGWDQRLCMDDDEYAESGAAALESYGEDSEDAEWWCRGKKKCDRHAGYVTCNVSNV